MNRRPQLPSLVRGLPMVCLCVAQAVSPSSTFGATDYELTDDSAYQEGCFEPCDCATFLFDTLEGTFLLRPVYQNGDSALFDVTQVEWQFIRDGETVPVTGSGLYRIEAGLQRMTLDLQIGADELRHFDSGLVPLAAEFPEIVIAVAVNGFYCFDYAFFIEAVPAPVSQECTTWGHLKSMYR